MSIDPPATLVVPVNTEAKMTRNSTGRAQREEPGLPVAEERAQVVMELMPRQAGRRACRMRWRSAAGDSERSHRLASFRVRVNER